MVKQTVDKFELFMCYKHLPDGLNAVGFFMLRVHTDPIPIPSSLEQAKAVLPACFEMGTVGSKPLNALERMLAHVYIPMLMLQGQSTYMESVAAWRGSRLHYGKKAKFMEGEKVTHS